jgi:plastocyanin
MRPQLLWLLMAAAAGGCSGSSSTAPSTGNNGPAGMVTVGNIFFQSAHNGTQNPAIDTVAVGTTVTWTWTNTGSQSHSVQSQGMPSFTSSVIQSGDGKTFTMTFSAPGTYQYNCAVHGNAMTGTIVVQ